MVYLAPILNIVLKSLRTIGKKIVRDFNEIEKIQSSIKGTSGFADNSLKKLKKDLLTIINEIKPNYDIKFFNDKLIKKQGKGRWTINPLEGYQNFIHGIPHFCITVAATEENEIIASAIYDPIKDEMFYAYSGKGAYLNDTRIRVSSRKKKNGSILAFNIGINKNKLNLVEKIKMEFSELRQSGCPSLDLCYLASGRFEGYIQDVNSNIELSACRLILKESGGILLENEDNSEMIIGLNMNYANLIKEIVNKT